MGITDGLIVIFTFVAISVVVRVLVTVAIITLPPIIADSLPVRSVRRERPGQRRMMPFPGGGGCPVACVLISAERTQSSRTVCVETHTNIISMAIFSKRAEQGVIISCL